MESTAEIVRYLPAAAIGLLAAGVAVLLALLKREIGRHRRVEAELRRARDAAQDAARAKSDFLARMSHEIRTPMNAILGSADLLFETSLTAAQREYGTAISSSAETLLLLIEDVLDFAKAESGKMAAESIPFHLGNVVEGVTGLLRPRARRQGVELALERRGELPQWVRGDPARLRQVLLNILDNAIKFTPEGRVTVEVTPLASRAGQSWIRFAVRDTGIGIPAAAQAYVFDAFRQADASTSRRFGGTGLGLSICKKLVELMGGWIGVESAPGAGSTFFFELPFAGAIRPAASADEDAGAAAPGDAVAVSPGRRSGRVLVVEDNSTNQRVALRMLESLGYRADPAADGRAALAALAREPYDLVLMDCEMPELDGYETTREIRRRHGGGAHLPVIAVTAHVMPGDREKSVAAGMDDYLAKPVRLRDLGLLLARWLPGEGPEPAGEPSGLPPALPTLKNLKNLDRECLETLTELDRQTSEEWLAGLIEDYLAKTPPRLVAARRAVGDGDAAAAARLFHALAGSSENLGAAALGRRGRELLHLARGGEIAACGERLEELEAEYDQAAAELREVLAGRRQTAAAGA